MNYIIPKAFTLEDAYELEQFIRDELENREACEMVGDYIPSAKRAAKIAALVPGLVEDRANLLAQIEAMSHDAARYRWLRSRDVETIHKGGVFVGVIPDNLVINYEDCDRRIDEEMAG